MGNSRQQTTGQEESIGFGTCGCADADAEKRRGEDVLAVIEILL